MFATSVKDTNTRTRTHTRTHTHTHTHTHTDRTWIPRETTDAWRHQAPRHLVPQKSQSQTLTLSGSASSPPDLWCHSATYHIIAKATEVDSHFSKLTLTKCTKSTQNKTLSDVEKHVFALFYCSFNTSVWFLKSFLVHYCRHSTRFDGFKSNWRIEWHCETSI